MAWEDIVLQTIGTYKSLFSAVPPVFQSFVTLFLIVVLMTVYSVFVWKLHKFIGTKNLFELNLNQYNKLSHPFYIKLVAILLYLLEYIIILPILILFWFAMFSIFLILVMDLELKIILFISAAVIATVRIASYIPKYGETIAREIAKLLPLNLLAIALLTPKFFDIERIIGNFSKLGEFFSLILHYLAFIIILEMLLRFFELILDLLEMKDIKVEEKEKD